MPQSLRDSARERRRSAIHEAGHVLVARQFGLDACAFIWPSGHYWVGLANMPGLENVSVEVRWIVCLAGVAAEMKMRGIPAKDFFRWESYLRGQGDFMTMGYTPTRDNAQAVKHVIDRLISYFNRDELWRVSTAVIQMSRDKQNANLVEKWKSFHEQEYPVATAASTVAA